MSNAFLALIWWVVPALGLVGALGYVVWVTKFEGKFQQETQRSVGQFQRFQESLRDSQARDSAGDNGATSVHITDNADQTMPATNTPGSTVSGSNAPGKTIPVIRPDAN